MQSDLEVKPSTDPEVVDQPDASKYVVEAEPLQVFNMNQRLGRHVQPGPLDGRNQHWRKTLWRLALITIFCLAAALGAGLGAGLSAQHKSTFSRYAPIPPEIHLPMLKPYLY